MAVCWEPWSLSRVEVDEVWKSLGRYGRYQMGQIALLLVAFIPVSYPVLSVVFEGVNNPHVCRSTAAFLEDNGLDDNASVTSRQCDVIAYRNSSEDGEKKAMTSTCDGYEFELAQEASFMSDFSLVCDRAPLVQLSQTLVMAGMLAGASLLSNLADRYGRKTAQVASNVALFALSMALAFVPNYAGFVAVKFFIGVFQQSYLIPLSIHMLEMLPKEQRTLLGVMNGYMWSLSVMTISPIAYALKGYSWRTLQIAYAAFHAFAFIEFFLLDESLRWLVANNRFKSVTRQICKAARRNKLNPEEVMVEALAESDMHRRFTTSTPNIDHHHGLTVHSVPIQLRSIPEEDAAADTQKTLNSKTKTSQREMNQHSLDEKADHDGSERPLSANNGRQGEGVSGDEKEVAVKRNEGFLDMMKDSDIRLISFSMDFVWMTISLTYYGIMLLTSSLAGNAYLNFFLGALLEIPANTVMWLGLARIGRKKTSIIFLSMAGIAMLIASVSAAVGDGSGATSVLQTVFSLCAWFSIAGAFNSVWVYTPELFPTNVRNIGVGLASSCARVGGMAAPFSSLLASVAIWAPGALFSVFCLLATFLLTLLPETNHRPLPKTIADVKAWRRADKRTSEKDIPA